MAGVFFGLLILLNFILYSKYESRAKRRYEGCMYGLLRRLIFRHGVPMQGRLSESTTRQSASVYTHSHGLCLTSSRQILRHYSEAHAQTSRRRLSFIHSLHAFRSIDQVRCSRDSMAALQPALSWDFFHHVYESPAICKSSLT